MNRSSVWLMPVAPPYNLVRTLTCGQVFRWRTDGNTATGVFTGRPVTLRQRNGSIEASGLRTSGDAARIAQYLGVDQSLIQIEQTLAGDPVLRRLLPQTTGIALLRQDPWECLVSFVISAFNNIPKIEMTLDRLSRMFGDRLSETAWSFPGPDRLARADLRELRRCLLGYRAPHVREIARRVDAGRFDLASPAARSYEEGRVLLLSLPGVGAKVADCVLLFAYGKGEAFPVDIWVKRAVERWYFRGDKKSVREIQRFARRRFGGLAGYAQQHLYLYERAWRREGRR